MRKKSLTYKIASTGILGAMAIGLNFMEGLIPPLAFLPPGAKLGLSNVVIMYSACNFGIWQAVLIAIIKSFFVLITRGGTAFLMSLLGGIFSAVAVSLLMKLKRNPFGFAGIAIISAVVHNLGQLLVAWAIMGSIAVTAYAPYMIIFGVIAGCITGILLKTIMPFVNRLEDKST